MNLLAKLGEVRRICLPSLGLRPRDGRQILLTSPRFTRRFVPDLIQQGILTPIEDLAIDSRGDPDCDEGFVHDGVQEVLTRGHQSMLAPENMDSQRCPKVLARGNFSNNVDFPTKFSFPKMPIYFIILKSSMGIFRKSQKVSAFNFDQKGV